MSRCSPWNTLQGAPNPKPAPCRRNAARLRCSPAGPTEATAPRRGRDDRAALRYPVARSTLPPPSLGNYEGSVALIVNVASACGLTPQYAGLEQLYETYRDKGFTILGFPANDFGAQEPGTQRGDQDLLHNQVRRAVPDVPEDRGQGRGAASALRLSDQGQAGLDRATRIAACARLLAQHGLGPANETDILWISRSFWSASMARSSPRFAPDITPQDPRIVSAIESELAKA